MPYPRKELLILVLIGPAVPASCNPECEESVVDFKDGECCGLDPDNQYHGCNKFECNNGEWKCVSQGSCCNEGCQETNLQRMSNK